MSSKSVQWETSYSGRTDGRTDVTKLIVAFRNFSNAPNKTKTNLSVAQCNCVQYCNSSKKLGNVHRF